MYIFPFTRAPFCGVHYSSVLLILTSPFCVKIYKEKSIRKLRLLSTALSYTFRKPLGIIHQPRQMYIMQLSFHLCLVGYQKVSCAFNSEVIVFFLIMYCVIKSSLNARNICPDNIISCFLNWQTLNITLLL
jgi:hypothetical protein